MRWAFGVRTIGGSAFFCARGAPPPLALARRRPVAAPLSGAPLGPRALLLPLLLLPVAAHATVLIAADLSELTADATAIVHGRVVDVRAEWLAGRRAIETYVTVAVATYFKGDLGEAVTFRVAGGRLGAYRSFVVGAPAFNVGEEVVLFLGSRGPTVPYVVGFNQGVYRVRTDPATGRRTVIPPALVAPEAGAPVRLVRGDPGRPSPTLERFAADVRALVARAGAAR